MKRALAHAIVRFRIPILVILVAFAAWCATMIPATNVNYDLNRYLSADTMTQRALRVMEEEFGTSEQLRMMFADLDHDALDEVISALEEHPQIHFVDHNPSTNVHIQDGVTYQLLTLTLNDGDATELVSELRGMFDHVGTYYVGGSAATQLDVQHSVGEEMPLVMLISLTVVLAVLLLTSHAWLEPFIILFVLGISIIINMGTNFVFDDVSFITFAVCAVLQLALSIDYAIMLLRSYDALRDQIPDPREAMTQALVVSFMRITSSALTTVAGLMALLFMSFTIGFDIGLVLSKGIFISMLCVFLLLPASVLLLRKPFAATRHTPLRLGADHLAAGIFAARIPVTIILGCVVGAGVWLSSLSVYTFTSTSGTEKSESAAINQVFGASNPLVLLVPAGDDDADFDEQRRLIASLEALELEDGTPAVYDIQAMVTTASEALDYYTAKDVAEVTGLKQSIVRVFFASQGFEDSVRADALLDATAELEGSELLGDTSALDHMRTQLESARSAFIGPHYTRILMELGLPTSSPQFTQLMDEVLAQAQSVYGDDFYVTGTPMSSYDIAEAFQGDLLKVNLITLCAILAIVALSFRALVLPLLLVLVIEGAIFVNIGISRVVDEPVFFISYLICVAIQMGATIDYGILLADRYRTIREEGRARAEALKSALESAMPTVLTSGIILTTAGFIVGRMCSIYYISSIGYLISRGALVSVVLVLTLLPALLVLCDRKVVRMPRSTDEAQKRQVI